MTLTGDFTKLYGIDSVADAVLEEQLVENISGFFDWSLLNIGSFYNVLRPSSKSKFHVVDDPNLEYGRVWECSKANWIWEPASSITYPIKPINISGIYIDDEFVSIEDGDYYINYRDGQIIFNEPLSSDTTVVAQYAYRRFNFYDANADWFQQVVFDPLPEGDIRDIFAKNRVYLPAVIIEVGTDATLIPYELGNLSVRENQTVLFHVIADQDEDRDKMIYILKRMYQKTIWLYNINKVADADKFVFNLDGSLSEQPLIYPDLIEQFAWKRCSFVNIRPQDVTSQLPLFRGLVRATLEIIVP